MSGTGGTAAAGQPDVPVVVPDSHLTLHYRVRLADADQTIIDTFEGKPATLQLGTGQLAESIEQCFVGLREGQRQSFRLPPSQAYGDRNPELVQRVPASMLARDPQPQPGDVVSLPGPHGQEMAAILKSIEADTALLDFNHPLAGHALSVDVWVLGVL